MPSDATELLRGLLWLVGLLGSALLTMLAMLWRRAKAAIEDAVAKIGKRLDQVDEDARELRDVIHDIDRRLIRIEAWAKQKGNADG